MIPVQIAFAIFLLLSVVSKSRTFFILTIAYFLNAIVDVFTSADDAYLMLLYTSMDCFSAIAILYFGDIQKTYHAIIFEMMIFCHLLMELALVNNYVEFIESDLYVNTIMFLVLCQILGADHGINRILNSIFDFRNHLRKIRGLVNSHRHKSA